MVQTPAPAPYVNRFHSADQQTLGSVKLDAMSHNFSISRARLRLEGKEEARAKVLNPAFVRRIIAVMRDAIDLCVARLEFDDNDYDLSSIARIRRFNPRLVLKSCMQAAYPADFPEEQARVSCSLLARYEAFLQVVATTDVIENLPSLFCIRFLDALEAHIRVFGEDRPETLEELKESSLARLQFLLNLLNTPNLPPIIRAATQKEMFHLMTLITSHGWSAEAAEIQALFV